MTAHTPLTVEQLDELLPNPGTLPARVIQWFAANLDEELYSTDIALRFEVASECVATSLRRVVSAGFLSRTDPQTRNVKSGASYGPGPHCVQAAERLSTMVTARTAASRRARLPVVDVRSLVVETGVPIRPPYRGPKGHTRYDAVFDLLAQPDTSTTLPASYHGSIEKAAKIYAKRTQRRLQVVRESLDRIRIHRLADKPPSASSSAPSA